MTLPLNPTTISIALVKSNTDGTAFAADETFTGATVAFAPASLDAAGNPVAPAAAAYTLTYAVPATDFAKLDPATNLLTFPLADLKATLANGTWAVVANDTATPNGTSAFSATPAFFTIAPLAVPVAPTVAVS